MVWKHDKVAGDDGKPRCGWVSPDPLYQKYHDREWGRPLKDDRSLFELLTLEGCQAGLSWITVLRKREHYRKVYDGFDPKKIARYTPAKLKKLLADPGIIRHRGKIEAAIANARHVLAVQREFGSFAAYVWRFASAATAAPASRRAIASETEVSRALARDLKTRGFRFVGPTTVYAFMQAMGLVNDHLASCRTRRAVEVARARVLRRFPEPRGAAIVAPWPKSKRSTTAPRK